MENGLFYVAPYDPEPMIVPGYYRSSHFYVASTGSTVCLLSTSYTYYDIPTGKYYKCTSTSSSGAFTELTTTTLASQPKYQRAWTQSLPTTKDGYYY